MAKSDKPELKRAFLSNGNLGEQLGPTKDWVSRIDEGRRQLRQILRPQRRRRLKLIARRLNQLWNKGGIQYAPPIR